MNDTANLTLALASSPIMSGNPEEVDDLGTVIGAVVLNMGTLNDRQIAGALGAGRAANRNHKPIILDPVGVGATSFRKETMSHLMNEVHVTIIKGNAGEIGALAGLDEVKSRGVDSDGNSFKDPAGVVRALARRESEYPSLLQACVVWEHSTLTRITCLFAYKRMHRRHVRIDRLRV